MIALRTLGALALWAAAVALAWWRRALHLDALAALDATTALVIGGFASVAGALAAGLQAALPSSGGYLRLAGPESKRADESWLVALGGYGVCRGSDAAAAAPARSRTLGRALFTLTFLCVGLIALDNDATAHLERSAERLGDDGAERCPSEGAAAARAAVVVPPGCELVLVEPSAIDERIAHRPHEDPLWLDWDPTAERDGTDPNDKDFLFGLLMRAVGVIERGDDALVTVARSLDARVAALPLGRVVARAAAAVARRLGRHLICLGDAYAALNGAGHHLIQALARQALRPEPALTARAYGPELERRSRQIVQAIGPPAPEASPAARAAERRILWLARFLAPATARRRALGASLLWAGALTAAVGFAVTLTIREAVRYHPIYVDRMARQQQRLDEFMRRTGQHGGEGAGHGE